MMNILIAHFGSVSDVLVASSINHALRKQYKDHDIVWVVEDPKVERIFRYNEDCRVYMREEWDDKQECNLFINMNPSYSEDKFPVLSEEFRGIGFSQEADQYIDVLYGDKKSNQNLFQIYYRMAGLRWRGESFDLRYYPKSRSKKSRAGVAVANGNLRRYIKGKLELESMNMWLVPYRENIFRHMDEINRCSTIITDDFLTMNLAIYLRKKVHYLKTVPLNFELEFFGTGEIYPIPPNILLT